MINKKLLVSSILAISTTMMIVACNNEKNGKDDKVETYSCEKNTRLVTEETVKCHYVDMAEAVYADALSTGNALKSAIESLTRNPTDITLEVARNAYKVARRPYQQSEIMRFDSSITADKNLDADGGLSSVDDWEGQVNAWPLDEMQIESIINGTDEITMQLLIDRNGTLPDGTEDEANVTTGIHAIEYLLWDQDVQGPARGPGARIATEFGKDSACQDKVSQPCRMSLYLKTAAELLSVDLAAMLSEWRPIDDTDETKVYQQGTLAYNFLTSPEGVDYMVQAIGNMAVGELGGARISAGLWRDGVPNPGQLKKGDYEEEHDCFSDLSHYAVYYNFQGIMNAWTGTYTKENGEQLKGASLAYLVKSISTKSYSTLDVLLLQAGKSMDVILEAGESGKASFDQIIAQSEAFYAKGEAPKQAELRATEDALVALQEMEEAVMVLAEAMSLAAVDGDSIGETD